VTVYSTEMHVNKMLSVHKDGSPWVRSRCFLLRLITAVTTATGAVTVTEAVTTAAGATNTVTPFAAVTEAATTATTDIITLLAAIYS